MSAPTKHSKWLMAVILYLAGIPANGVMAAKPEPIQIRMQIYRIMGNFDGNVSLTDDVDGGQSPADYTGKGGADLAVFSEGKLMLGNRRLTFDPKEWAWDGKPLAISGTHMPANPMDAATSATQTAHDSVLLLSSPQIIVPDGAEASMSVGSTQPLEYFVRRADGLFERRTIKPEAGLSIEMRAHKEDSGRIFLEKLKISSVTVSKRQPVEGTALDIGVPVLDRKILTTDLHLMPGQDYALVMINGNGMGFLFVRLRIDSPPVKENWK